jgi:hypothetical protein
MNTIEKLGLAIMIMSAMYIPEGGIRGGVCTVVFFAGWCLFSLPLAHLTKRALDGRKRGAKSKSLNGKGGSKAARQ